MQVIQRIISLEDFKSRTENKFYFLNNSGEIESSSNNNWGFIPLDVSFGGDFTCPFEEIKNKILGLHGVGVDSINEQIVHLNDTFRYKDILKWKIWLEEYNKTTKYYKLCKRGEVLKWVEIEGVFLDLNYQLGLDMINSYTNLPSFNEIDENISIGDVVEVNVNANVINDIFRVENSRTRFEIILYEFINEYFEGVAQCTPSIPFIDIPFFIKQEYDSIGIFTSQAKEWNPKQCYYKGEIVIYNNDAYVLVDGERTNIISITGNFHKVLESLKEEGSNDYYNFIEITSTENIEIDPLDVYTNNKRNIFFIQKDDELTFYFPSIAHKAEYNNESGEFIFDTEKWVKNEFYDDVWGENNNDITLPDGSVINRDFNHVTTTESRISTVRRYKKSVDEDGNTLSFIISEDASLDTELIFKPGVSNISIGNDDLIRADVVNSIIIINDVESEITTFSLKNTKETIINKKISIDIDKTIPPTISLKTSKYDEVVLNYIEELNTFSYHWVEKNKSEEPTINIEYNTVLPPATENQLGTHIYISSITDDITYYYEYICEKKEVFAVYTGVTNSDFVIRPSHVSINVEKPSHTGTIEIEYTIGAIMEEYEEENSINYICKENSGIKYFDTYPYEILIYGINYTLPNSILREYKHTYEAYDYTLKEGDKVRYDEIPGDLTQNNVGEIYRITDSLTGEYKYKRILSNYTAININYEEVLKNIENTNKKIILSNIRFTAGQTVEDSFQVDNIIKNEALIGVENCKKKNNIFVERGTSSAFEKLHILSEVKSFSDLENYKNNYFKI